MVQIYTKNQHEKRGHWSSSKPVLSYDHEARTITVPGSGGRRICAAIEDVRIAGPEDELSTAIQDSIDNLDELLNDAADSLNDASVQPHPELLQNVFDPVCSDEPNSLNTPSVGDAIEVWWPDDKQY